MPARHENGAEPQLKRAAFKPGQKEQLYKLHVKNSLIIRRAKAEMKEAADANERIENDIEANGYLQEAQGELDVTTNGGSRG